MRTPTRDDASTIFSGHPVQGVELWWPLTDQRSKLGIEEMSYYQFATLRRGLAEWMKLCVVEVALFGPIFLLSVWANRRRYAR